MEDFQEALPTDNASGFSSPAASGSREGYGGAFILDHSEAAHAQAKAIRSQLASMAATRIKQQEGLLRMGDVPIKGALTEHIYNHILPAKQKFHEKMSKISQRSADDPNFLRSKEGRDELLAAEQDKLALQAMVQASVNANTMLTKNDALYNAKPGSYKSNYIQKAADVRKTPPTLTSGLLTGMLEDRPDYLKFVKEASGNVGKLTTESIVGDKTVTNENLGAKFNERLERSVDAALSTQEGKDNIENIAELDKISYADAEKKVRQNIKDAIDTKYAEKTINESERSRFSSGWGADKYLASGQAALNKPINMAGQEETVKWLQPMATKGGTKINKASDIIDMNTGKPVEGTGVMTFLPATIVASKDNIATATGRALDNQFYETSPAAEGLYPVWKEKNTENPQQYPDFIQYLGENGFPVNKQYIYSVRVPLEKVSGALESKEMGYQNVTAVKQFIEREKKKGAKNYSFNGKTFSQSQVEKAAKASGVTVDEYIKQTGLK